MSVAVLQLVERGWATKEPNPADARSTLAVLTDAGRDELARVRRTNGERIAAALVRVPDLTDDDLETTVRVLREILDADPDREGAR